MTKNTVRIALLTILLFQIKTNCLAQLSPINFETGGYGASWIWTTFENDTNPAPQVITNPFPTGINTSDKVVQFTALQAGQPWAGFESLHGSGIGTFTLDSTNSIVKVMVYKSVISDVGVKFVTPSAASTGELKVSNTVINQWEELIFDFTSQIGHPAMVGIDQIVIFPDFDLIGRTSDNICYIDNITMGTTSTPLNIDVLSKKNIEIVAGENLVRINSSSSSQFDQLEIYNLMGKRIYKSNAPIQANENLSVHLERNKFYTIRLQKGTSFLSAKSIIID